MAQIAEGIEIARQIMAQKMVSRYVTSEVRPGAGAERTGAAGTICTWPASRLYHPVGTCRMGDGPDAVVDADLRLHGMDGLWVADASIMPTLPAGNTNATAMLIGDKGSDHVLRAIGRNATV